MHSLKLHGRELLMTFWQTLSSRVKKVPLWPIGLGIGITFLVVGILGGQLEDIYRKAVMICLECIGIG